MRIARESGRTQAYGPTTPAPGPGPTTPVIGEVLVREEELQPEQTIAGRYRLLSRLGEGGMAVVFLAEHIAIEKKVAVKVLRSEFARRADVKERFLQEARAAARIGHPNIVDITDFGETSNGSVFFVMEYLRGIDLAQLVSELGLVPWKRAQPILLQICRALEAAHGFGVIHRDMKPANVFLVASGSVPDQVKVLDFGIAKVSDRDERAGDRMTRTGMIFGTPEYMSPEQALGETPDHRIDVYALGVILYELLTGRPPFRAESFMGVLSKHLTLIPPPPSEVAPEASIPPAVDALVMRALSKQREDRFATMAEMIAAIEEAAETSSRPVTGPPPPPSVEPPASQALSPTLPPEPVELDRPELAPLVPSRRRRATTAAALGAIALVAGLLGIAYGLRGRETPTTRELPLSPPPQTARAPVQPVQPTLAKQAAASVATESPSTQPSLADHQLASATPPARPRLAARARPRNSGRAQPVAASAPPPVAAEPRPEPRAAAPSAPEPAPAPAPRPAPPKREQADDEDLKHPWDGT